MTSTAIVAYLALFTTIGFLFVLASLLLGKVVRAQVPTAEKLETYECGEPAVGPASVQFDLRFYVVALLFLIFEVEVAFFFPPATVFGRATHLLAGKSERVILSEAKNLGSGPRQHEILRSAQDNGRAQDDILTTSSASKLALGSMLDLGVFFAVLLVGFAYLWRCGDLEWVRAVGHPRTAAEDAAMAIKLRSEDQS
jgi:NADH-quinone oxidoreductase subunit A